MRIAFATVGCRLNQFETDALRGKARAAAHEVVPFEADADVYVINTCTITADADADSRQLARRAVRRNPSALVVVTGCYAQGDPERRQPYRVDLVIGTARSPDCSRRSTGPKERRAARIGLRHRRGIPHGGGRVRPRHRPDRTRAFLKVQEAATTDVASASFPRCGTQPQPGAGARPGRHPPTSRRGLSGSGLDGDSPGNLRPRPAAAHDARPLCDAIGRWPRRRGCG